MSKIIKEFYCYHISNWDEVCALNPEASVDIESAGLSIGALPAKVDSEKGIACFFVEFIEDINKEHPDFSEDKLQNAIISLGFQATLSSVSRE